MVATVSRPSVFAPLFSTPVSMVSVVPSSA